MKENSRTLNGGIAQLGEHLICIQKVAGSIPVASTKEANKKFFKFFEKKRKKRKKDVDGRRGGD